MRLTSTRPPLVDFARICASLLGSAVKTRASPPASALSCSVNAAALLSEPLNAAMSEPGARTSLRAMLHAPPETRAPASSRTIEQPAAVQPRVERSVASVMLTAAQYAAGGSVGGRDRAELHFEALKRVLDRSLSDYAS